MVPPLLGKNDEHGLLWSATWPWCNCDDLASGSCRWPPCCENQWLKTHLPNCCCLVMRKPAGAWCICPSMACSSYNEYTCSNPLIYFAVIYFTPVEMRRNWMYWLIWKTKKRNELQEWSLYKKRGDDSDVSEFHVLCYKSESITHMENRAVRTFSTCKAWNIHLVLSIKK